jgi:hypothetical protein
MSAEEDRPQVRAPEKARRSLEGLVQRFARNRDLYTRPQYKETRVRVEFIDPFFEALGWDVRNVQGYEEHDPEKHRKRIGQGLAFSGR